MKFLTDRKGLSLVEYIVGGAIALIVLAASVWGVWLRYITKTR